MSNKRPAASPGFQVRSVTNGGPFDFHDTGAVQPGVSGGGEHFQVVKKRKAGADSDLADKACKDKGLKSITLKVCDVVRERRVTNYPDVADALVLEVLGEAESKAAGFTSPLQTGDGTEPQSWEKNIRRRVYDALNVLCVMDVIEKQQKNIVWKGLPDQATSHYQSLVVS
jgi:transcription factor Dp-1